METRLLILNCDPVFQDRALAMFDAMRNVEIRIVRSLTEAVHVLLREDLDLFVVEGESAISIEQATDARQHFPSLEILCLSNEIEDATLHEQAMRQNLQLVDDRIAAIARCAGSSAKFLPPLKEAKQSPPRASTPAIRWSAILTNFPPPKFCK